MRVCVCVVSSRERGRERAKASLRMRAVEEDIRKHGRVTRGTER